VSETGAEREGAFKTGKHDDLVTSHAVATHTGSLLSDRSLRLWVIEDVIYDLYKKGGNRTFIRKKKRRFKDKATLKIVYDKTKRRIEK
jgi:hypothetical protein